MLLRLIWYPLGMCSLTESQDFLPSNSIEQHFERCILPTTYHREYKETTELEICFGRTVAKCDSKCQSWTSFSKRRFDNQADKEQN